MNGELLIVLGVDLALSIDRLAVAVVHVILLVVVCDYVVVNHWRHLRTRSNQLWVIGTIEAVPSLVVALHISPGKKLGFRFPDHPRSSTRHLSTDKRSSGTPQAHGCLTIDI